MFDDGIVHVISCYTIAHYVKNVKVFFMARNSLSKYNEWMTPENLLLVEGWRRDGLSDTQIANNIGINVSTVYKWRKEHEEFGEAYKKGTEVSTYEVENALYKSAVGHYVVEEEITETTTPMGVTTTKKKHKRYIAPNTAAQIFILKNRRPDWWKDKREIESNAAVADDGFLQALESTVEGDWAEIEDDEVDGSDSDI